eukprot:CAMPEP_0182461022 /NCGR_PEP_ID=MMETSP1319-20130603/5712_1 /TAXON_ID=172717 /ORGANISM="Bolidomonas pacifica, Strain RCC208" /LENGTH=122 /DNA_ID=CAMNT_0024660223 /DNA_START=319 /DNA_END=687 /DNA_ORIENTATION=-
MTTGRIRRGIIHSKRATGNNVSHSKRRTKRTFLPNTFPHRLYSELCDKKLGPFQVSASGLRDVDKCGGLDNYVIKNPYKRTVWEGQIGRARELILKRWTEERAKERWRARNPGATNEPWDRV